MRFSNYCSPQQQKTHIKLRFFKILSSYLLVFISLSSVFDSRKEMVDGFCGFDGYLCFGDDNVPLDNFDSDAFDVVLLILLVFLGCCFSCTQCLVLLVCCCLAIGMSLIGRLVPTCCCKILAVCFCL